MAQEKTQLGLFDFGGSPAGAGLGARQQPPLESNTELLNTILSTAQNDKQQNPKTFIKLNDKNRQRLRNLKKRIDKQQSGNVVSDRYVLKEIANIVNGIYHWNKGAFSEYQKDSDQGNWAKVDRGFYCGHAVGDFVPLRRVGKHIQAGMTAHCENLWICPFCSSLILNARADELEQLEREVRARGKQIVMLTLTAPHSKRVPLKLSLRYLQQAHNKLGVSRVFKKAMAAAGNYLQDENGAAAWGRVKSVEITHGRHGWHPHYHILVILDDGADIDVLAEVVSEEWLKALQSVGVVRSTRAAADVRLHGCTVTKSPDVRYLAKEMTAFYSKEGRADGSTNPFDILIKIAESADSPKDFNKYLRLWVEYVCATWRLSKIKWAKNLKHFFAIGEKSDEELLDEEEHKEHVAGLTLDMWNAIRKDVSWSELESYVNSECDKVAAMLSVAKKEKEYKDDNALFNAVDYYFTKHYSHLAGEVLTKEETNLLLSLNDNKTMSDVELLDAYKLLRRVKRFKSSSSTEYTIKDGYLAKRINCNTSVVKRFTNKVNEMARAWGRREFYHGGLPVQLPTLEQLSENEELAEVVYSIYDERDISRAWWERERYEEEQRQQEELNSVGGTWPRVSLDDMKNIPF